MKRYFVRFILVSVILIVFGNAANAALPSFSHIYFFGDSLTDKGNYVATNPIPCFNVSAPVTNPSGGTYPGNVWADFMGLGNAVPGSVSNPTGNDWAVAGAQTKDVLSQAQNFVNVHGGAVDPTALYVIWAGADDILDKLFFANPPADPKLVIVQGMSDIVAIMTTLVQAGAKNFLVLNLPDISLAPLLPQVTVMQRGELKQVVEAWNATLTSKQPVAGSAPLQFMQQVFHVNIYFADIFSLFNQVVANPSAFGSPTPFSNTLFGKPNNDIFWCGVPGPPDPDTYIFFNYIHPTGNGHHTIATYVLGNAVPF